MKLRILAMLIVIAALVGCFVGCELLGIGTEQPGGDEETCQHVDSDGDYFCDECGEKYTDGQGNLTPECEHKNTKREEEDRQEPTCTDEGYYDDVLYCLDCDEELERETVYLEPHGHRYLGGKCLVCDEPDPDYEPPHDHDYVPEVTDPTCTEDGYTTYICDCGDSYVADKVPAQGHDYVDGACTVCGEADPDYVYELTVSEALDMPDGVKVAVSGTVSVAGAWNPTLGYMNVTIVDGAGNELYVYKLATEVRRGDIVIISGTITTYGGNRQIAQGATAYIDGHDDSYDYVPEYTIPEAIALPDNTNVTVIGTVTVINIAYNEDYNNITVTISDEEGNTLYVYRLNGNVSVGDMIKITGAMGTHNGQRQIAEGAIFEPYTPEVHEHDYESVVTEPTCTEAGLITYTCACGHSYTESIPALGHPLSMVRVEPTCTEDGSISNVCVKCGYISYSETVPALGHKYDAVVVDPTCLFDGYTVYTCHCGDSYIGDYVPTEGHQYNAEITPPTCTEDGYTTFTCAVCGNIDVGDVVPTLGHQYGEVVTEPTCDLEGYTTFTCTACGDSYVGDETDPIGHSFEGDVCVNCGIPYFSEGLRFRLSEDETYYVVVGMEYDLKEVIIPSEYKGLPVREIGFFAFEGTDIISVTIGEGVTLIGPAAFYDCRNLEYVSMPDSVNLIAGQAFSDCRVLNNVVLPSSLTVIENAAFESCNELTEIVIPDNVVHIGDYAFQFCVSLSHVVLGESVEYIGDYAFDTCTDISKIALPETVTYIGDSAFNGCKYITEIYIPESVSYIGDSALAYTGLNRIEVADGNEYYKSVDNSLYSKDGKVILKYVGYGESHFDIPEGVVEIASEAFADCEELVSVNMPDGLITIGYAAFIGCENLTDVVIPETVTSIGASAFGNCYAITSIVIPDSVITMAHGVFDTCKNLSSVKIGKGLVEGLDYSTFGFQTNLKEIIVNKDNPAYKSVNNVLYTKDGTVLINYPVGSENTEFAIPDGVVTISDYAFSSADALTVLIIPDSVTHIGQSAFYGTGIRTLTLPSSVTHIGGRAFDSCLDLSSIVIPSSVTEIGGQAFYRCDELTVYTQWYKQPAGWNDTWNNSDRPVVWSIECIHIFKQIDKIEHTCTEDGYTVYACENCDLSYNAYRIPAEHTNERLEIAPTCTEEGRIGSRCTVCGNTGYTQFIPALGHDYVDGSCIRCSEADPNYDPDCEHVWIAPTCTEDGYCKLCKAAGASAFGHDWTEPTCETDGYCIRCGEIGESALGHDWSDVTCDMNSQCKICGSIGQLALGHDWVKATCTESGYCRRCNIVGEPSMGHQHVPPTCTEDGYCMVCKETFEPAMGHEYFDGYCTRCFEPDPDYNPGGDIDCDHSYPTYWTETRPTCTTPGERNLVCTNCYYVFETEYIPTTGYHYFWQGVCKHCELQNPNRDPNCKHTTGERIEVAPSRCVYPGEEIFICADCDEVVSITYKDPTWRHEFVDGCCHMCGYLDPAYVQDNCEHVWIAATCTEDGYCEKCKKIGESAKGHSYLDGRCENCGEADPNHSTECQHENTDWIVTNPASCGHYGERVLECFDCRSYLIVEKIEPTGQHQYSYGTCNICGAEDPDYIPEDDHKHEWVVNEVKEPTCYEEGYVDYYCTGCDDNYTETIPRIPHTYEESVVEPTCTEEGYTMYNCTMCGYNYPDNIIEPIGHDFVDGVCTRCKEIECYHEYEVKIEAPTCTTEGISYYYCLICGHSYHEISPTVDHTPNEEGYCTMCGEYFGGAIDPDIPTDPDICYHENHTEASCTEDSVCLDCGTILVNAYGHQYIDGYCHCGEKDPEYVCMHNYESFIFAPTCTEEGSNTYTCTMCGDSYTETIPRLEHVLNTTTTEPTCTESGYIIYTCANCGLSKTEETTPAFGHIPMGEGTVTEPTCTKSGYTVYSCGICGVEFKEDIPPLGHSYVDFVCTVCGTVDPAEWSKAGDSYLVSGDYIYFGEHPQTIKDADVEIYEIQDDRGYYLGSDGYYYLEMTVSHSLSGYTYTNGEQVKANEVRYFKVEPIRWRILTQTDGTALILCDSAIFSGAFAGSYVNSNARELLTDLYTTLFNELQRSFILSTELSDVATSDGNHISDHVFLLSHSDVINADYGFSSDADRQMMSSDYYRALGGCMSFTSAANYGYAAWQLRTMYDANHSRVVWEEGYVGYVSVEDYCAIIPAMWIVLK